MQRKHFYFHFIFSCLRWFLTCEREKKEMMKERVKWEIKTRLVNKLRRSDLSTLFSWLLVTADTCRLMRRWKKYLLVSFIKRKKRKSKYVTNPNPNINVPSCTLPGWLLILFLRCHLDFFYILCIRATLWYVANIAMYWKKSAPTTWSNSNSFFLVFWFLVKTCFTWELKPGYWCDNTFVGDLLNVLDVAPQHF